MKKLFVLIAACVCLCGCGIQETMETISDLFDVQAVAPIKKLSIQLPEEASAPTLLGNDGSKLYECDGYTLCIQTLDAGDLDRTLRSITGFGRDNLTIMETQSDGVNHYNCVWSAAGENGDHVGRGLILDDGDYHYTVTVMAEFSQAGKLSRKWKELFDSVAISDID